MYAPPPGHHVFKIRIADKGEDFVEIQMDSWQLSYSGLLERICQELQIETTTVERLRKLPETRIRNDEDVKRFNAFEGIEVILKKPEL